MSGLKLTKSRKDLRSVIYDLAIVPVDWEPSQEMFIYGK